MAKKKIRRSIDRQEYMDNVRKAQEESARQRSSGAGFYIRPGESAMLRLLPGPLVFEGHQPLRLDVRGLLAQEIHLDPFGEHRRLGVAVDRQEQVRTRLVGEPGALTQTHGHISLPGQQDTIPPARLTLRRQVQDVGQVADGLRVGELGGRPFSGPSQVLDRILHPSRALQVLGNLTQVLVVPPPRVGDQPRSYLPV